MDDHQVVVIAREDLEMVEEWALQHRVSVVNIPSAGIDPVTLTTLSIVGATSAVAAVIRLVERHKGGQVIDLRSSVKRTFYRSSDVVFGLVVVIAEDGKVVVMAKNPDDTFGSVVETVQKFTAQVGEASAKSVSEELGKRVLGTADVKMVQDE